MYVVLDDQDVVAGTEHAVVVVVGLEKAEQEMILAAMS